MSKSSTREATDSSLKGKDDNNSKELEGGDKKKKSKKDKTKEQKSVDKTEEKTVITEDTDNAPEDGKQSDAGGKYANSKIMLVFRIRRLGK